MYYLIIGLNALATGYLMKILLKRDKEIHHLERENKNIKLLVDNEIEMENENIQLKRENTKLKIDIKDTNKLWMDCENSKKV